jgi:hypothetical protein
VTSARLKRLEALERRRRPDTTYVDPFDVALSLFELFQASHLAVAAGKAEWIPSEPDDESTWSPAMAEAMKYYDRLAKRLAAEGGLGAL